MIVSKYPSLRGKIKSQEKMTNWGAALGFREQFLGIWTQWSHLSKNFRRIHLGFDPIYKTQKWFAKRPSGLIYNIFYFLYLGFWHENEDANGLRWRKEELTYGSYLDNLVDALMMMIYVVPINLRRFGGSFYVKQFAQGNQCALSLAQQTSTISDLMRQDRRTNATKK